MSFSGFPVSINGISSLPVSWSLLLTHLPPLHSPCCNFITLSASFLTPTSNPTALLSLRPSILPEGSLNTMVTPVSPSDQQFLQHELIAVSKSRGTYTLTALILSGAGCSLVTRVGLNILNYGPFLIYLVQIYFVAMSNFTHLHITSLWSQGGRDCSSCLEQSALLPEPQLKHNLLGEFFLVSVETLPLGFLSPLLAVS